MLRIFCGGRIRKGILIFLVIIISLTMVSCSIISSLVASVGIVLGFSYAPSSSACNALISGSAKFSDLPLSEQWGLMWQGMFSTFSESTRNQDSPDITMRALRAIGIRVDTYDTAYFEATENRGAFTVYYYRVSNRDSLIELATTAVSLIEAQTDPATAADWAENLYNKLLGLTGENSFILGSYTRAVERCVKTILDSGNTFSTDFALYYSEKYPAGAFAEIVQEKLQSESGTNATFIG